MPITAASEPTPRQLLLAEEIDPSTLCIRDDVSTFRSKISMIGDYIDYGIAAADPGAIEHARVLADCFMATTNTGRLEVMVPLKLRQNYMDAWYARAARQPESLETRRLIGRGLLDLLAEYTDDGEPFNELSRGPIGEVAMLAILDNSFPALEREGHGPVGLNHDAYRIINSRKVPVEVKYTQAGNSVRRPRALVVCFHVARLAAMHIRASYELQQELQTTEDRLQMKGQQYNNGAFRVFVRALIRQQNPAEMTQADRMLINAMHQTVGKVTDDFGHGIRLNRGFYWPKQAQPIRLNA